MNRDSKNRLRSSLAEIAGFPLFRGNAEPTSCDALGLDIGPGCGGSRTQGRAGDPEAIYVGEGCFIGANVTVLPGVNVGEGCVIAAGAVITRDCAPDGLYGGVPARRIRDLAL